MSKSKFNPLFNSKLNNIPENNLKSFFKSKAWRKTKEQAIILHNKTCSVCKARTMLVSHIQPLKISWRYRLSMQNLQLVCEDCNPLVEFYRSYNSLRNAPDFRSLDMQNKAKAYDEAVRQLTLAKNTAKAELSSVKYVPVNANWVGLKPYVKGSYKSNLLTIFLSTLVTTSILSLA